MNTTNHFYSSRQTKWTFYRVSSTDSQLERITLTISTLQLEHNERSRYRVYSIDSTDKMNMITSITSAHQDQQNVWSLIGFYQLVQLFKTFGF